MSFQTVTQIRIGQQEISTFVDLKIEQGVGNHHYFELQCRMDTLEANVSEVLSDSRNFLNEKFVVEITSLNQDIEAYKIFQFKGVVTQVKGIKGYYNHGGDIVTIKGYSPTILSDSGPDYASYNDMQLSDIINDTFTKLDKSKFDVIVNPSYSESITYSVQHNESSFEYANRLAKQYGEWFYYDGKQLNFGKPEDNDSLKLKYAYDLDEFSLELIPISNKYNYFANDYFSDQSYQSRTSNVSDLNGYVGFSSKINKQLFIKETNVWFNTYGHNSIQRKLDVMVEQQKLANEGGQVKLLGTSHNPGVCVGRVISIQDEEGNYGNYRVVSTSHSVKQHGKYKNVFTAIPIEATVYPHTDINAFPQSDTQVAVVIENADPLGMGRVKVQFAWQKLSESTTPWIRMLTPHAGGDKGFHFTPEIGEEVMIGFQGGNAERPYVLGSLYNGSQSANIFRTENNDVKAIKTRAEHLIEFNDAEGGEYIKVTDRNNNAIEIDTVGNNITISCAENMTIRAKNIDIEAQENLNVNVGENKNVNVSKNYNFQAQKAVQLVAKELQMQSKEFENNAERITMNSTKDNMELSSAKQVVSNSSEKNILI